MTTYMRLDVECDCCGKRWTFLGSTWVFGAKSYCDNCNRPAFENELKPCDHQPWKRRFTAILRQRQLARKEMAL